MVALISVSMVCVRVALGHTRQSYAVRNYIYICLCYISRNMETKIQSQIDTVAGIAIFVKTLSDKELWAGDYSTRNGYWVIHRGANHHVYKVYPENA